MVHAPPRAPAGAPPIRVNLYSDTQTRPTAAMKQAMLAAEVGDEQAGLDPTIDALCDRMAALLGKEAAMFLPSGTMCNRVALLTHCRPGDGVLAHETAHSLVHRDVEVYLEHRGDCGLEAESIAFVVLQHFGINSGDYTFGYVTSWEGGGEAAVKALKSSATRIQQTAKTIIEAIEATTEDAADQDDQAA